MAASPEIVDSLVKMKAAGLFRWFIDYIRFPKFRNLEPNSRIDFEFPFTVFVGQNGCGKSSALTALYGAPAKRSTGTYWFATKMDPIAQKDDDRHCFIYSYAGKGTAGEVLKTRIMTPGKPERWDTSESIAKYKMLSPGTRLAQPVEMEVVFINFRTAQNAFEKKFHEERPPVTGVQDHLRFRSVSLSRVLNGQSPGRGYRGKTHDVPEPLSEAELKEVSLILGRSYKSATLIKHRFFDIWGYSVVITTEAAQYTEAFAASGESAVVLLVHEISVAKPGSLLLLDEPETSLHPGAQARVQDFLLRSCREKKHQIVVCSHAPAMVEGLPPEAVKVFTQTLTGKFRIVSGLHPAEAFFFLGQPISNRCVIYVEDKLARFMVQAVLEEFEDATKSLFDVRFAPGGHTVMKNDALHAVLGGLNYWYLFDGDALKASPFGDEDPLVKLRADEVADPSIGFKKLYGILENWLDCGLTFNADGNDADRKKLDLATQYARFAAKRFSCFPSFGADAAIWDDDLADSLAPRILGESDGTKLILRLKGATSAKAKFREFSDAIVSGSQASTIETIHKMFITNWKKRETSDKKAIQAFICAARDSAN